ncbi:hypothetical protein MVEN_01089300 [Mycena venus]|uniref:Tyr recombinase domain-containing protein n=1 Tax=Mycena venus TaxID=2733690 RepID=A0A8H7CXK5_9AGAR|nr:hypothetical protein MVEN_01089300 [Mycena venus]
MIDVTPTSRQPNREPWTLDRLYHERAIALGLAIDPNTNTTYTSALNSFITFVKIHGFPIEPTEETLSLFAVFMSAHINPRSVNSYLSGICNQLEPYFPDVRARRNSPLVTRTVAGCMRRYGTPVRRKRPICEDDIIQVIDDIGQSTAHDDRLFLSMLTTGRDGLLRLGEMTTSDTVAFRSSRKLTLRHTQPTAAPTPRIFLRLPLLLCDALFPLNRELWLRSNGAVPTCAWFITRLKAYFPHDVAGQSLRAGGATSLAEAGVPPNVIQGIGRWASDAFQIYIRKNPVLLQAMLFGRPVHQPPAAAPL